MLQKFSPILEMLELPAILPADRHCAHYKFMYCKFMYALNVVNRKLFSCKCDLRKYLAISLME